MTNEEFNRRMEFIVEQQAQFAADIQILKEREERLQQRQERFQSQLEAASARQDRFDRQIEALGEKIEGLSAVAHSSIDTSTKAAEIVTRLAEAQAEAQAETQRQIGITQRQVDRVARLLEEHVRRGHPQDPSQN